MNDSIEIGHDGGNLSPFGARLWQRSVLREMFFEPEIVALSEGGSAGMANQLSYNNIRTPFPFLWRIMSRIHKIELSLVVKLCIGQCNMTSRVGHHGKNKPYCNGSCGFGDMILAKLIERNSIPKGQDDVEQLLGVTIVLRLIRQFTKWPSGNDIKRTKTSDSN